MTHSVIGEKGVIYAATRIQYIEMACISALSIKKFHPEISITLFGDQESIDKVDDLSMFDKVIPLENPQYNWNDKLIPIATAPYEKVVFMDADTHAIRPFLDELYAGLDWVDLLVEGQMCFNYDWEHEDYSAAIRQFNTGVVAYNLNDNMKKCFDDWQVLRKEKPECHDQPTFREAVLRNRICYAELPVEYNMLGMLRTDYPIKVIHMREINSIPAKKRQKIIDCISKAQVFSFFHWDYGFIILNWKPGLPHPRFVLMGLMSRYKALKKKHQRLYKTDLALRKLWHDFTHPIEYFTYVKGKLFSKSSVKA